MSDQYVYTNAENLVKISQVDSEIFGKKCQFLPIVPKVKICHLVISGTTEPKFTKYRPIHVYGSSCCNYMYVHPYCDIVIRFECLCNI